MSILQLTTNVTGLADVFPRIIYISTDDTLNTVLTPGYLNKPIQMGYVFYEGDMAVTTIKPSPTEEPISVFLSVSFSNGTWSLVVQPLDGEVELGDINDLAFYPSTGQTIGPISTANSAMLRTNSLGVPSYSTSLTNGQILIGSTGGTPNPSTITAGAGISVLNGTNSITISSTGSGEWVNQITSSVTMNVDSGYTINAGGSLVTLTLPSTSTYGDSLEINGMSAGGWTIAQQAGQSIIIGSASTTVGVGGSISSSNQYDCVFLRCIVPNNTWTVADQQSSGLTYV